MRGQPEGWPQNYRLLLDRRFGVPHTPHGTDGRTRTSAFLADRPAARPVELHQYVLQRVVGWLLQPSPHSLSLVSHPNFNITGGFGVLPYTLMVPVDGLEPPFLPATSAVRSAKLSYPGIAPWPAAQPARERSAKRERNVDWGQSPVELTEGVEPSPS